MAKITVTALTASAYVVPNGNGRGDDITMISVSFGAKALHHSTHDVKNTAEATSLVKRIASDVRAAYPGSTFQISTRAMGRKPVGFDAVRGALNPSFVAENRESV